MKIYYGNNERLSLNLGVSPSGMHVAHPTNFVSQPSRDEQAYQSYSAFCRRYGVTPKAFDSWVRRDSNRDLPTSRNDGWGVDRGQIGFHGSNDKQMQSEIMTGHSEPANREWDGSWDNAV